MKQTVKVEAFTPQQYHQDAPEGVLNLSDTIEHQSWGAFDIEADLIDEIGSGYDEIFLACERWEEPSPFRGDSLELLEDEVLFEEPVLLLTPSLLKPLPAPLWVDEFAIYDAYKTASKGIYHFIR